MSDTRPRRSQLSTPARSESMMAKAASSAADEVILDLEDSIAPEEKSVARTALITAANNENWDGKFLSYRINGIDTRWWYEDIITVLEEAGDTIDSIVVPKVQQPSDVATVANLLTQVEVNASLPIGSIGLQVQIEDGAGFHTVDTIAQSSDRLESIIFGPGDYAAAMGAPGLDIGQFPSYPGHYWHAVLSHINAAAKSANLYCFDGPYADIENQSGFRESANHARMLGCDGKWVIHPSQIDLANEIFSPDPAVVRRARQLVTAYEQAQESGEGAVSVDGQMVDEATHKMAKEIVNKADAAGSVQMNDQ